MEQEIVREESGNYVRIKGRTKAVETWSEKIFAYEEIPGFLPLEIRRIDGEKEYYYPISGKVTLKQHLTETDFHLEDLKSLFLAIFEMAEVLEEYLLDSRGLVLREDMLFVEPNEQKIYGIYWENNQKELVASIGELLEFIMEKMNQKEKELVFFVYGMHKQTKEENCSREILKKYVERAQRQKKEEIILPDQRPEKKKDSIPLSDKKGNPCLNKVNIAAGGIFGIAIVCLLGLWKTGVFISAVSQDIDYGKLTGAVIFFFAVSGYGAWRLMTIQKKKNTSGIIIGKEEEKKVCLIPQARGGEPIPVTVFPFRMGSDKKQTNYVIQSEDISPFHAEIRQEGGSVMIVDEESAYGTYRNERQLIPWQPVLLRDGDVIRLARWEYVVEITNRYMSCE